MLRQQSWAPRHQHGEAGPLVAFCHGLFGQGKNWTTAAKALATDHRVLLSTCRTTGGRPGPSASTTSTSPTASPRCSAPRTRWRWSVTDGRQGGDGPGAAALELVERLCVVDISPVDYEARGEFAGYIEAMQALDLSTLEHRRDADAALTQAVPSPPCAASCCRTCGAPDAGHGGGWAWQPNLDLLGRDLPALGGWPEEALTGHPPYPGRTLWVAGENSSYIEPHYAAEMERWFPRYRKVTIRGAGHWVHSEQPEVFLEVLRRFLAADR